MDLAALVERFHACATRAEFEAATLDAFAREVGFDVAFFASHITPPITLTSVGLDDATLARVHRDGPTYGAELLPVKHAALASRGVAVDTEVLGERGVARCAYYRDLARPIGGRHSLLGYTRRLGVVMGGVMLGRTGSAFRETERRCVEDALPLLGLVSAVFERPAAPTEDVTSALTPHRAQPALPGVCANRSLDARRSRRARNARGFGDGSVLAAPIGLAGEDPRALDSGATRNVVLFALRGSPPASCVFETALRALPERKLAGVGPTIERVRRALCERELGALEDDTA